MTNLPRILIVGTTPYNPNESSRALDTYFHNYPANKLRMIFSNENLPPEGHCSSFFQITDYDVFHKFLNKEDEPGRILTSGQLSNFSLPPQKNSLNRFKKKNAFRYYARKSLWNKKRWLSSKLEAWVEEFSPEAVYICFSDDYFILDIAYYFANKFNIPVIAQIGDDYYFKKNRNLLMKPYLKRYRRLFDKIMSLEGFGVYISDKLADKYNHHFKLQGYPFYLSSKIKSEKSAIGFEFNYFGKVNLGRSKSLGILADALHKINPSYKIDVYTSNISSHTKKYLEKHNCVCKGFLQYEKLLPLMNSGSFNIVASGFQKKYVEEARYSLSTKISDLLASSGPIIAIGPEGDGAIDFLDNKNCSIMLKSKRIDANVLKTFLNDIKYLSNLVDNANGLSKNLFDAEKNRKLFESCCVRIYRNDGK